MESLEHSISEEALEKKEAPKDIKDIFVLFHGNPRNSKLSYDARLRGLAALEIAQQYPDANIYLVGGGMADNKKESGSEKLSSYLSNKMSSEACTKITVLGASNNTDANIEEIIFACLQNNNNDGKLIITSKYHVDRVRALMQRRMLEADVVPAEVMARKRSKHHDSFIERYEHSSKYIWKEFVEKLGFLYIKFDSKQKLIEEMRKHIRS